MHIETSRNTYQQTASALADYDFLRSTYEMLLRAQTPNYAAMDAAFESLEAVHRRLKAAHENLRAGMLN